MKRFFITLLASLSLVSVANAAAPDYRRTMAHIYLPGEFAVVPSAIGCHVEAMCTRVENWTGYWISPGLMYSSGSAPGNAFVFSGDGLVQGIYVGDYTSAGVYTDPVFGPMPKIIGDFRPAIAPSTNAMDRPGVSVTMPAGVTTILADQIAFVSEMLPPIRAYDVRKGYVVSYTPGTGTIVRHCTTYKDVLNPGGSPELAASVQGECH